jgi:O-antigen/teichoic acid export membrane protein
VLGVVMVLQWNINAVMLSQWAEPEDVGWYAASQRLVGFLIFPCSAVIGSLYPTLCRLLAESRQEAQDTARAALATVSWIALPVAIGCAVFPDIGVQIFSRESFGPAEDNLRVSSLVVFGLYFSMVLATYLNALGLQRVWALLQLGSVAVSSSLNVFLIPLFVESSGNGGLGVVTATVFSEAFLVAGGIWLGPRGLLHRPFFRSFGWALLAALCMAVAGGVLRGFVSPWLAAPVSVGVYVAVLRCTGVLNADTTETLRDMLRLRRARSAVL